MARFSQYPLASSTDYTDDVTFLILAPDGTVKQATLEGLNDNYLCGIKCASLVIPSADVLTLNTTPVAFGLTVSSGYYVSPISIDFKSEYGGVTYATNLSFRIRNVGSSGYIVSALLNYTADTFIKLLPISDAPLIEGADLECYVQTGDPTAGDSDITIYLTYRLVAL